MIKFSTFSSQCFNFIKDEIKNAKGKKKYFLGRSNFNKKLIDEVHLLEFKDSNSLKIIIKKDLYPGDIVFYNSSISEFKSSTHNLEISAILKKGGIALILINNELNDFSVLLDGKSEKDISNLDENKLIKLIDHNGLFSKYFKGFEKRFEQINMLKEVIKSFNFNKISLIEAGTGVGKSLSYLIPSIYWALNNKEPVVISTNTINLQEQLLKKDIPILQKILFKDTKKKIKILLIKGRSNYLCLKKLNFFKENNSSELFEIEESNNLKELFKNLDNLEEGSRDEVINFIPKKLWKKIASEESTCSNNRCYDFESCFFHKARKNIKQAQLLLVNHHILCSDIAIKGKIGDAFSTKGILPPYSKLIIDEAHHFNQTATYYLGFSISRKSFQQIISRIFQNKESSKKGVLGFIKNYLQKWQNDFTFEIIKEAIKLLNDLIIPNIQKVNIGFDNLFELLYKYAIKEIIPQPFELTFRIFPEKIEQVFYQKLIKETNININLANKFNEYLKQFLNQLDQLPFHLSKEIYDQQKDLEIYQQEFLNALHTFKVFVFFLEKNSVYWMEIKKTSFFSIILHVSPLEVSKILDEYFFQVKDSIILTSATLTSNNNFHFIKKELGLEKFDHNRLHEVILGSPFNYKKQMTFFIPNTLAYPQDSSFKKDSNEFLIDLLEITQGRTFLLYTSYQMLNESFSYLSNYFKGKINLLKQGTTSSYKLIENFKNTNRSVLFATDSFWEGVDVKGRELECVVIVKLPFRVPTEPLIQAKFEKIKQEGRNAFIEYSLPQSVIKFRQGVGRLIRTTNDKGIIVCLDKRLINKSYGKIFLNSIPKCSINIGNSDVILDEIEHHF